MKYFRIKFQTPVRQATPYSRLLFCMIFFLLTSCLENNSDSTVTNSTDSPKPNKKMTVTFYQDNSYSTYLVCSYGNQGIDCSGQPQTVPTMGSVSGNIDVSNSAIEKINNLPDGCYSNVPNGEVGVFLSSSLDINLCPVSLRLYSGNINSGSPIATWGGFTGGVFSAQFPYLKYYTFSLLNLSQDVSCSKRYLVQERPSYSQITQNFTVSNESITFSTLFSLQIAPSMSSISSVSRNNDFIISYIPALDTQSLKNSGATDENIIDYLTPHLGDFILLGISDSYGHKGFCKKADAIQGSFTVPSSIMKSFYDNTSFVFTRYKILKKQISNDAEISTVIKVNQYTSGTDAYGQTNGNYSVFVQ